MNDYEGEATFIPALPDLLGLCLGKIEKKVSDWMLEREIKWTRRNLELTEREIADRLQAKRELTTKLMNLEMERGR